MGTKDSKAKEYISDNARFADLCNYVLYDGKGVIKPENLKEQDTTEVMSIFGIDQKTSTVQKLRDVFKNVEIKYTDSMYIVLIGVENQSNIHYAMPVKNMIYDALAYGKQVNAAKKIHDTQKDYNSSDEFLSGFAKTDELTPVITITLYLGSKPWDGPRKLTDMMKSADDKLLQFVPDYNINLIDPSEITDFTKFKTQLRQLFEVLHNAYDKDKLWDVMQSDETFKRLDRETVEIINEFAGTDIKMNRKDEVIDMCKAWDDMILDGKREGIREGKREGIREGQNNMLYSLVQDGSLDIEIAAKKINMTVDEFKKSMEAANYKVPELV